MAGPAWLQLPAAPAGGRARRLRRALPAAAPPAVPARSAARAGVSLPGVQATTSPRWARSRPTLSATSTTRSCTGGGRCWGAWAPWSLVRLPSGPGPAEMQAAPPDAGPGAEALQLAGLANFSESRWWNVGRAKLSGEDLNYFGLEGFRIAGGQGILIIVVCQARVRRGGGRAAALAQRAHPRPRPDPAHVRARVRQELRAGGAGAPGPVPARRRKLPRWGGRDAPHAPPGTRRPRPPIACRLQGAPSTPWASAGTPPAMRTCG